MLEASLKADTASLPGLANKVGLKPGQLGFMDDHTTFSDYHGSKTKLSESLLSTSIDGAIIYSSSPNPESNPYKLFTEGASLSSNPNANPLNLLVKPSSLAHSGVSQSVTSIENRAFPSIPTMNDFCRDLKGHSLNTLENQRFTSNASTSSIHNDLKMILEKSKSPNGLENKQSVALDPYAHSSNPQQHPAVVIQHHSDIEKSQQKQADDLNLIKLMMLMVDNKKNAEATSDPAIIKKKLNDEPVECHKTAKRYIYSIKFLHQVRQQRAAIIDQIYPDIFKAYCYCMNGKYWDPEKYFDIVQFPSDSNKRHDTSKQPMHSNKYNYNINNNNNNNNSNTKNTSFNRKNKRTLNNPNVSSMTSENIIDKLMVPTVAKVDNLEEATKHLKSLMMPPPSYVPTGVSSGTDSPQALQVPKNTPNTDKKKHQHQQLKTKPLSSHLATHLSTEHGTKLNTSDREQQQHHHHSHQYKQAKSSSLLSSCGATSQSRYLADSMLNMDESCDFLGATSSSLPHSTSDSADRLLLSLIKSHEQSSNVNLLDLIQKKTSPAKAKESSTSQMTWTSNRLPDEEAAAAKRTTTSPSLSSLPNIKLFSKVATVQELEMRQMQEQNVNKLPVAITTQEELASKIDLLNSQFSHYLLEQKQQQEEKEQERLMQEKLVLQASMASSSSPSTSFSSLNESAHSVVLSDAYKQLVHNLNNHPLSSPSELTVQNQQSLEQTNLLKNLLKLNQSEIQASKKARKAANKRAHQSQKSPIETQLHQNQQQQQHQHISQSQYPEPDHYQISKTVENALKNAMNKSPKSNKPSSIESLIEKIKLNIDGLEHHTHSHANGPDQERREKQHQPHSHNNKKNTEQKHFNSLLSKINAQVGDKVNLCQQTRQIIQQENGVQLRTEETTSILKWFNQPGVSSKMNQLPGLSVRELERMENNNQLRQIMNKLY